VIQGKSKYTNNVIKDYEWEWEFQDTYLEGPILDNVDLKIGRQVVKWGYSDSVRVLDILNPLDQREPGRADIEDLARSVGMAKVDWYVDRNWTVTAIAIPEIRFNDIPSFGSDFNPLPTPIPTGSTPDDFKNWEAAASVKGIFEGWDVSFHYAYIFNDIANQRSAGGGTFFLPANSRLHLVGAGGNYAFGSWLVKGEIAWLDGLEFLSGFVDGIPVGPFSSLDRSRLDATLGLEYYGLTDHTFALEVVERYLFDHTAEILDAPNFTRENTMEYALRWTADWFNTRLTTTVLAILLGYKVQDGVILRAQGEYELMDGLALTAGFLLFQKGDLPPLNSWGLNDRAFVDLKYSF
jgi:hypothetical protein